MSGVGSGQGGIEFMSKLKGRPVGILFPFVELGWVSTGVAIESKLDTKDMKVGLLAIMVKGDSPSTPRLDPKISRFIAFVVAVG